jgi:hypothetical protein
MNILALKIVALHRDLQAQSSDFLENGSNNFYLIIIICGGRSQNKTAYVVSSER